MCLVNFIKQDDCMWTCLQLFGQLTALIVTYVSWWRTNELGHLKH